MPPSIPSLTCCGEVGVSEKLQRMRYSRPGSRSTSSSPTGELPPGVCRTPRPTSNESGEGHLVALLSCIDECEAMTAGREARRRPECVVHADDRVRMHGRCGTRT